MGNTTPPVPACVFGDWLCRTHFYAARRVFIQPMWHSGARFYTDEFSHHPICSLCFLVTTKVSLDLLSQTLLVGDTNLYPEHSSHFSTLMNYSTQFSPLCPRDRFSFTPFHQKGGRPFSSFVYVPLLLFFLKMNCLLAFLDSLTHTFHTRDGFVLTLQVQHLYQSAPYVA